MLYVVTGSVEIRLAEEDSTSTILEAHDSIAYHGTTPHSWRMLDPATVVLLISRLDDPST